MFALPRWFEKRCSMMRATLLIMGRALHVRLDDEAAAALALLRADAASDSDAVRAALKEAAARRRMRAALLAEVKAVAADPDDRDEMMLIREQLSRLAPSSVE